MRDSFLPFSPPCLDDDEIAEVVESLRSGWITTGPKCRAFEKAFAAKLASPASLAVSSCTAAMHTALAVLGIGVLIEDECFIFILEGHPTHEEES